jgi:D-xylose transport system permease protein
MSRVRTGPSSTFPLLAIGSIAALGAAIGILQGWLVAVVGIPSFIVTLALFLAWQGVLLCSTRSRSASTDIRSGSA